MIEARELRIGNWIYLQKGSWGGKYHHVSEGLLFNHAMQEKIPFTRAILLTPEILEKCGFTTQKYEEWEAFAYKDTPICAHWDGVDWVFKYGYDSDLSFASCQYLHQLQNLIFALTHKELEIQL